MNILITFNLLKNQNLRYSRIRQKLARVITRVGQKMKRTLKTTTKKTRQYSKKYSSKSKHMKENEEEPEGPCTLCGYMYADPKDPKIVEFWLQCKLCNNWQLAS